MADIPNNQLSQVGRFRGYACSARQTHTTIVHPATSMLCAVRLPITKNKAHIVETGLIPRNDRTAASGPRPRYCHYSTQSLSCGATNVLQKCYECAAKVLRMCYSFSVIHNHCVSCVNNSIGMGMSPGPSIMSAIRLRMWSMRRRQ